MFYISLISSSLFSDMADPYLRVVNSSFCSTVQCEQGCDENNGNCICKKGYRLDAKGVCQGEINNQTRLFLTYRYLCKILKK